MLEIIKQLNARPIIQCADTGDVVATRVDRENTHSGWKTEVLYWLVPSSATSTKDAVPLSIEDLAGAFFVNPISPTTGNPLK